MDAEITIFGHPFALHCWKVYIACRERGIAYEHAMVDPDHPRNKAIVDVAGPMGQFPVLEHDGRLVIQTDPIIEYLDVVFANPPKMIPEDRLASIEARQMARVFDDYVGGPLNQMVRNALRPEDQRDPYTNDIAQAALDRTYRWLDGWMEGKTWAANDSFSIAECSAASQLFYTHWAYQIPEDLVHLRAYHKRLLERPSIASVIDEARPMRRRFPLWNERAPDIS